MRYVIAAFLGILALSHSVAQDGRLPIRHLTLDEMQFADKALGVKFRRLHLAAERLARQGWDRKSYQTFPDRDSAGVAYAHWCTFLEDGMVPINYGGPKEAHSIQLGAFFTPDPGDPNAHKRVNGSMLYAKWKPADAGWSAYLSYGQGPRFRTTFDCVFHYHPSAGKPSRVPSIEFFLDGRAGYAGIFRFGEPGKQTEYTYSVPYLEKPRQIALDAEVKKILTSPESLRDALVVPYKNLLKRLNEVIPEDKGYTAKIYPSPTLSDRSLSDTERKHVLQSACDEVELKIRTVHENYREIFAAQHKALPLRACLSE